MVLLVGIGVMSFGVLGKAPLRNNGNILPHCFLLLHRDQKVGQAADLAHMETEKDDQQQTESQTSNPIPTITVGRRQSQSRINTYSYNNSLFQMEPRCRGIIPQQRTTHNIHIRAHTHTGAA